MRLEGDQCSGFRNGNEAPTVRSSRDGFLKLLVLAKTQTISPQQECVKQTSSPSSFFSQEFTPALPRTMNAQSKHVVSETFSFLRKYLLQSETPSVSTEQKEDERDLSQESVKEETTKNVPAGKDLDNEEGSAVQGSDEHAFLFYPDLGWFRRASKFGPNPGQI